MRPDQPRGTSRADSARDTAKPRNADALRARRRRLALESLEARTLLSVLPAPTTLTSKLASVGDTPTSNDSSPTIAVNPTNPLQLAAVWTVNDPTRTFNGNGYTTTYVAGATSADGGKNWTAISNANPDIGIYGDPSTSNPVQNFAQVTDPSIAWDRTGHLHLAEVMHNAASTTGVLVEANYNVTIANGMATATETSDVPVTAWYQGNTGSNMNAVFHPQIAVDNNVGTFSDPSNASLTQNDSGAGNIYIVDARDTPPPANPPAVWNRDTIELWTSTNNFSNTTGSTITNLGSGGLTTYQLQASGFYQQMGMPTSVAGSITPVNSNSNSHATSPKLAISQGTVGGTVAGGTVSIVFDDYGLLPASGIPEDNIDFTQVAAGGQSVVTSFGPIAVSTVRGALSAPYPLNGANAPADPSTGIGPAPTIAVDNTLGAFSPNEGRIYVAYVSRYISTQYGHSEQDSWPGASANPAANTDVFLISFNPATGKWGTSTQVNDDSDSTTDGYSDSIDNLNNGPVTGRSQFEPSLAVDQTTGTLAVSFLDARYDASNARVATTLTTSIDGGSTFSAQNMAFADAPNSAEDAITGATVTLGPIPENQSAGNTKANAAFAFGDHQGLAFSDGHLYPAFSGNENGGPTGSQLLGILVTPALTAAGPRVISGTMGPVGEAGDRVNVDRNPDGSPIADSFVVTFDRPVDPNTFTIADVTIEAKTTLGALLPTQPTASTVTPLNTTAFGATSFLVHFAFPNTYTPPEAATYSYAVGPAISDRIRTVTAAGATISGNFMDQNGDATTDQASTTNGMQNDAFSVPSPKDQKPLDTLDQLPFQAPYDRTTLPLIAPGPHVVSAISYPADGAVSSPGSTFGQLFSAVTVPVATNSTTPGVASAPLTIGNDTAFPTANLLQVTGLKVHFTITTPNTRNLVISLIAPDGTTVILAQKSPADPFLAAGPNFTGTILDDGSSLSVDENVAPFTGTFAPANPLSALNGHLLVGQWKLQVQNVSTTATASILSWSLDASTTAVSLDPTAATAAPAYSYLPIVFDRNMNPASLTAAGAILSVTGPDGVIPGPYTVVAQPYLDPNHPDPDPAHPRSYIVEFAKQVASGSFTVVLSSSVTSQAGDAIDANLNGGLSALRGDPTGTNVAVQYASTAPVAIATGTVSSSIVVPASDTYAIQAGVQVQVNITYPNDPDLTAVLETPYGNILLFSGVGATGTHANFQNTIFSDSAPTPIQQGGPSFSSITGYNPQAGTLPDGSTGAASFTALLVGQQAAGTYTLVITDGSAARSGTLNSWNLTFNKTVPSSGVGDPVADQTTIPYRVFNLNPTSAGSSSSWTAVGPAGIAAAEGAGTNGEAAGQVNAIAVDPTDPSGNTVFAGGASGGIWKTTNFLTTSPQGPSWTPLTDFGPALAANIGSIAIFPRNGDPNQSVIFATTGEGSALGDPTQSAQAKGIGVLRSMDGGQTWTLLDSTNNNLPFSSASPTASIRDHLFARGQGTASFKVFVDPTPQANGGIVVFMAISSIDPTSGVGGIWRSLDSGQTWSQVLQGQATDLVADLNSNTGVTGGNLQTYYAGIEGQGVYQSTNQGQTWSLMVGGVGDPLIQQGTKPSTPVAVAAPLGTPNGAKGRIVLARPALTPTKDASQDKQYQGWLYAAVVAAPGNAVLGSTTEQLDGLYMTKDFGQNWVKVTIPSDGGQPTNNTSSANYTVTGNKTPAQTNLGFGNYDLTLTVDPNNPNVVYLGGTDEFQSTGLIRVDVTAIDDAHAFYSSQDLNDGGKLASSSAGALSEANPNQAIAPKQPPYQSNPIAFGGSATLNLIRDPSNPFVVGATVQVANAGTFSNTGADVKWIPFDQAVQPDPFDSNAKHSQAIPTQGQHQVLALKDPLTGGTRLIFADNQGIYSVVAGSDGSLIGSVGGLDTSATSALNTDQGGTKVPSGSRNGNLQIAQLYSAAVQPSNSAATKSTLPGFFYGNTFNTGQPQSDPNEVTNSAVGGGYGDLSWAGDSAGSSSNLDANQIANYDQGSGNGVATDQTGSGDVYQYKWPISLVDESLSPTDFLAVNGVSKTNGLVLASNGGDVPDPEWPFRTGSNFAVNPINGQQVIISSQTGQIFRTENGGGFWSVIGAPNALDGSYAPAVTFGAPDPNGPIGLGNLDNFLYAGTTKGNIFVTQTGGGGNGNAWTNTTPLPAAGYFSNPGTGGSIDYSPVEQIVTDPTRGTHDAYAVTAGGANFSVPNFTPLSSDGNVPENTISVNQGHPTGHEEVIIAKDVTASHITVTANITYTSDSSLTVDLVAPDGTVYPLAHNANGSNFINTTFDDQATTSIYNAGGSLTGTFAPGSNAATPTIITDRYHLSLSTDFYGKDMKGTWTLRATTNNAATDGSITNWSLNYTSLGGVYYNPDTTSQPWQNISGDLYLFTAPSFGDSTQADTVARSLTSVVADWRYAIPGTSGAFPILYVGGDSGVFESIDGGATWNKFPASGGGLPEVRVTGLSLTYGDINSTTGRPVATATDPDILTASTYGRGEFAIELAPIVLQTSVGLDPNNPASEPSGVVGLGGSQAAGTEGPNGQGSDSGSVANDGLTADVHPFIVGYSQETAFGSTVTVNVYNNTPGAPTFGQVVGSGTTDAAGHFSIQVTGNIVPTTPSQNGDLITLGLSAVAPNGAVGVQVPFTFTLDATKPAQTPKPALQASSDSGTVGDGITNVNNPTFNVSNVEPDARLQLFRNGTLVNTILNVGATGGTVAIQDPNAEPDGTYVYTALQTDLAGNLGTISTGTTVTILTVKPPPPSSIALISTVGNDTGHSQTDDDTKQTSPSFNVFGVTSNDTLQLFRSGTLVATIANVGTVAAGAAVVITDPGPVSPDGTYTYTAVQSDVAGNASQPTSPGVGVTIDTTAPAAPGGLQLDPSSDSGTVGDGVTNINNPYYDVSGIEAGATVFLQRKVQGAADSTYATVNGSGTFTAAGGTLKIQDPGPIPNGFFVYRAYQVDLAGNQGAFTSPTLSIRILNGAPAGPTPLALDPTTDSGYGPAGDPTRSDDRTSATLVRFPLIDIGGIVAGSTVILFRDGVQVNSTVSAAGGTVKLTDPKQPYTDGPHTYTAQQIDASGDASAISGGLIVTFDNTPPAAPAAPKLEPGSDSGTIGDNTTNVTTPIFDVANVEPDAELELLRDGAVVNTLLHVAGGTISIQDTGPAPSGVHVYSAVQVDEAGNVSALGGGSQVTILTTGPTFTPSVPALTAASDSGPSASDGVTNATSPVFNIASSQAGVTVQLLRFTNGVGQVVASRVGPGTIQDPGPLASGYYGYEAREIDAAGNLGPASAMGVILVVTSTAPPSAPVLAPSSDSGTVGDNVTNVKKPAFNLTPSGPSAIAPGATITLFRNGVAVGSRVGAGPITDNGQSGQGLADGTYNYVAVQTDLAGNVSTASPGLTVTIVSSIAAPGTPTLLSPPGGAYTNVTSPVINIPTAPAGSFVSLFRNGLYVGGRSGAGPITDNGPTGAGLPSGTYTYTAYAQDQAGNTSVASGAFVLTIATSLAAPAAPALAPSSDSGTVGDNITNVNRPTINVAAAGPQVTVVLLRKPVSAPPTSYVTVAALVGGGSAQDANGGAGLADGQYDYVAYQVDPAGNVSAPGVVTVVTIRTTPPAATAAPTLDPSTDSSPGKGGVNTNFASPTLDVAGVTVDPTVPVAVVFYRKPAGSPDGSYVAVVGAAGSAPTIAMTDPGPLAQGSYTYATRQIDVAGNAGPLSVSKTINVLVKPPASPTLRLNPATDTGTVGDNVTASRTPSFLGTAQPGTTVVLLNAATGALIGTGPASTINGSFAIAAGAQGNGTLPLVAFAVDAAGNVSKVGTYLNVRIVTAPGDYNGDGKADLASFTPGASGAFNLAVGTSGVASTPFGKAGDIPVSGDFDGDGRTDVGVYRPSTGQYILQESTLGLTTVGGGIAGVSLPVVGDFSGTGRAVPAFFNPRNGQWTLSGGAVLATLGSPGDEPVPADYDGDGKADIAVYRPSTGQWFILRSAAGAEIVTLGDPTDAPVPADYDGDGKADIAVYRPSTGQWFIQRTTAGAEVVQLGGPGDIPVPEDFDGDGKADLAVFRPSTAQWIIQQSTAGPRIQVDQNPNDIPVPAPYVYRAGSLGLMSASDGLIVGSTGLDLGSSASAFSASPTVGSGASPTAPSPADASSPIAAAPMPRQKRAQARAEHARELAEARQARLASADARHHDHALESVLGSGLGRRRGRS